MRYLPKAVIMKNLAFITIAFLSILACKKPTNEPPKGPEKPQQTQTGADILWCKVNGVPHLYKGKPTAIRDNGVHAYQLKFADSSVVVVIHADDSKYSDGIKMYINITGEATQLPQVNKKYMIAEVLPFAFSKYYTNSSNSSYRVDSNASYILFTRFDAAVAAGIFEYYGANDEQDTVNITEGFFDIVRE